MSQYGRLVQQKHHGYVPYVCVYWLTKWGRFQGKKWTSTKWQQNKMAAWTSISDQRRNIHWCLVLRHNQSLKLFWYSWIKEWWWHNIIPQSVQVGPPLLASHTVSKAPHDQTTWSFVLHLPGKHKENFIVESTCTINNSFKPKREWTECVFPIHAFSAQWV